MSAIVVGVGDCKIGVSPGEELATYGLGSCIGLAVYDPGLKLGGLLHFMLPDSSIDAAGGRDNPFKFADTGIPRLLAAVYARGAAKRRLIVTAAGAADMLELGGFQIGKRNYLAMRRILWKEGLLIHRESIGGTQSRTIHLEIDTGNFWIQESAGKRALLPLGKKGANSCPIAS